MYGKNEIYLQKCFYYNLITKFNCLIICKFTLLIHIFLELKLGELVRHEVFGLFEAMSAIEMMDPKMDAGMCCNKSTVPLTFETALSVCI